MYFPCSRSARSTRTRSVDTPRALLASNCSLGPSVLACSANDVGARIRTRTGAWSGDGACSWLTNASRLLFGVPLSTVVPSRVSILLLSGVCTVLRSLLCWRPPRAASPCLRRTGCRFLPPLLSRPPCPLLAPTAACPLRPPADDLLIMSIIPASSTSACRPLPTVTGLAGPCETSGISPEGPVTGVPRTPAAPMASAIRSLPSTSTLPPCDVLGPPASTPRRVCSARAISSRT